MKGQRHVPPNHHRPDRRRFARGNADARRLGKPSNPLSALRGSPFARAASRVGKTSFEQQAPSARPALAARDADHSDGPETTETQQTPCQESCHQRDCPIESGGTGRRENHLQEHQNAKHGPTGHGSQGDHFCFLCAGGKRLSDHAIEARLRFHSRVVQYNGYRTADPSI